jgi:hypothetical protein
MSNITQNRGNICLIYDLNYPGGIAQLQISSVGAREFMDRQPARYVETLGAGQVATFARFTRIIIDSANAGGYQHSSPRC